MQHQGPLNHVCPVDAHSTVMCLKCHHKYVRMEQHHVLELDMKASLSFHVYMNTNTCFHIHSTGDYTKELYYRIWKESKGLSTYLVDVVVVWVWLTILLHVLQKNHAVVAYFCQ